MEKITIQELSKVLVGMNGLTQQDANRFATEMFSIILQHLQTGEQVKVKGLGTFKIINVEARESVSVRTGERVVIDSHSKVSFTPDIIMKELVNRPFSQFETVVLNDGVEFDDTEVVGEDTVTDDSVSEEDATPAVVHASVVEAPASVVEAPAPVIEEPAPVVEKPASAKEPERVEEEETEEEEEEKHLGRWLLTMLGILILMAASAFGGYQYASRTLSAAVSDTVIVRDTILMTPQDAAVMNKTIAKSADEPVAEPVAEPAAKPTPQLTMPQKSAEQNQPAGEPYDRYAAKDDRVRLGAYRIVGTAQEVTVLPGQTFYSICRAHLGDDMECYVEVYNDLPRRPQLKAGQVIKIPKLEWKKRKKRQ